VDFLRRSILPVGVRGPYGKETVEALVDTGFGGSFSLTPALIQRLGLRPYGSTVVRDAGGSVLIVPTYLVQVDWVGGPMRCEAVEAGIPNCLIGTLMLDGHILEVDFGAAKTVEVR
jgi:clan AA aspartic protease